MPADRAAPRQRPPAFVRHEMTGAVDDPLGDELWQRRSVRHGIVIRADGQADDVLHRLRAILMGVRGDGLVKANEEEENISRNGGEPPAEADC